MALGEVVVECKVLMEKYDAADVYIRSHHMLSRIGGEQHYRNGAQSEDVKQHVSRDKRFLAAASSRQRLQCAMGG